MEEPGLVAKIFWPTAIPKLLSNLRAFVIWTIRESLYVGLRNITFLTNFAKFSSFKNFLKKRTLIYLKRKETAKR